MCPTLKYRAAKAMADAKCTHAKLGLCGRRFRAPMSGDFQNQNTKGHWKPNVPMSL